MNSLDMFTIEDDNGTELWSSTYGVFLYLIEELKQNITKTEIDMYIKHGTILETKSMMSTLDKNPELKLMINDFLKHRLPFILKEKYDLQKDVIISHMMNEYEGKTKNQKYNDLVSRGLTSIEKRGEWTTDDCQNIYHLLLVYCNKSNSEERDFIDGLKYCTDKKMGAVITL